MVIFHRFVEDTILSKNKSFAIATDGRWDLMIALHIEANNKNIKLEPYWKLFFDTREEVLEFYKPPKHYHLKGLHSYMKYLNLPILGKHHSGIDDCRNISAIIKKLIEDGFRFEHPIRIPDDHVPTLNTDFNTIIEEPTLSIVLDILGLEDEEVLNVYQYGSRVYNMIEHKRWSFIIIVVDEYKGPSRYSRANIVAKVFTKSDFVHLLRENSSYSVLCVYLPQNNIWKNDWKVNFILCLLKLKRNIPDLKEKYVEKLWRNGDIKEAKREFVRIYRILVFYLQILKYDKIINFEAANEYQKQISESKLQWEEFFLTYQPQIEKKKTKFQHLIKLKFEAFEELMKTPTEEHLIKIIIDYGVDFFTRYTSLWTQKIVYSLDLIQLFSDGDTPKKYLFFHGIVLNSSGNYSMVTPPFPKIESMISLNFNPNDLQSKPVFPLKYGLLYYLFYYDNRWLVVPHISSPTENMQSYSDNFWKIWERQGCEYPTKEEFHKPFLFQLVSYRGMISNHEEIYPEHLQFIPLQLENGYGNWNPVKMIRVNSKVELQTYIEQSDPLVDKGIVLCSKSWNLLQNKQSLYLSEVLKSLNSKNTVKEDILWILLIIYPHCLSLFKLDPFYQRIILQLEEKYKDLVLIINHTYLQLMQDIGSDFKNFSKEASKFKFKQVLFVSFHKNLSIEMALRETTPSNLLTLLHNYQLIKSEHLNLN
uniref:Exonuclease domain-containing protein n=1 Tax=Arcella intermedia TaxID=1963864 RepID=A0A6B2KYP1_9EUKA